MVTAQPALGHVQKIIDSLVQLIRTEGQSVLPGKNIYLIPRYDANMFRLPCMWIYADEMEVNDLGFQDRYQYSLTIQVVFVVQQHGPNDRNRSVHRYEEVFQNLLIQNRQPLIDGLKVKQWNIVHISWIDQPAGKVNVDTATITLKVNYDRTVVS